MAKHDYKYTLQIFHKAMKALNSMPQRNRRQVGHAIDGMQRAFLGDIKKLKGYDDRYRLRVGDFRVMFMLVKIDIQVYEILDRKDAYGN
jgi:mRNA interferase RelE/StbE